MHIHAFSPMEIVYGVELTGMPLADYLSMLRDNGLGTLPGTAAEILDDEIRHILSANKLSTAQWIEVIRTAHRCGIRTHFDHDVWPHRNARALGPPDAPAARDSRQKPEASPNSSRSASCIRTRLLFQQGLARTGPTLAEHLKVHALARLLLAGSINNIQVSWVKLNRQLSQLCLHAGANDYGGTLMEENISREAGATAGQYTSPEDFQALILEAGRIPAERNTTLHAHQHSICRELKATFQRRGFGRTCSRAGICMNTSPSGAPIAILGGTGPAGMGLALRWARAGETIIIGSRDAQRAQRAAGRNSRKKLARSGQRFWHGEIPPPAPQPTSWC
jgi:hypothetical protein